MRRALLFALLLAAAPVLAREVIPGPGAPTNGSVTTVKLADGAVTTAKLADANVTDAKLTGQVSVAHGGTGANLSASTGILKDAAGVCSVATLVDADVSASAAISRSKVATGTANALVVDSGTGALSSLTCADAQLVVANATPAPACVSLGGDATLADTGALTLANSGVAAASYGDASHAVTVAFDAKGRATSASAPAIAIGESAVTSLTTDLSARALKAGDTFTGTVTLAPTTDVVSLDVKQTSAVSPVSDLLDVTSADGLTNDFKIDSTGASTFRGTVTATTFSGALSGNATTATTATNFSGSLAGDVTGTQAATTVGKIQGRSVAVTAPADGNALVWVAGSTAWAPGVPANATTAINFSGSLAGDVTGTQAATTVGKINGAQLGTTTATSGNLLVADGTQWLTKGVTGDATLASTGALTVVGLRGNSVSASSPTTNSVLEWSGSAWTPTAQVSQQAFTATGTITGTIDVEAVIQAAFNGTITLPAASTSLQKVTITDAASAGNTNLIRLLRAGTDTIDYDRFGIIGLTSLALCDGSGVVTLTSDGAGHWLVSHRHGWAFDPTTLANLSLWLTSTAGVTQAAGTVSAWADQSGLANNAAQGTGANQPAYNTTQHGLPTLYFDGAASFMSIVNTASLQPGAGSWTVVVVAQPGRTQGGDFPPLLSSRAWASSSEAGWADCLQSSTWKIGSHFADGTNGHDVGADLSVAMFRHDMMEWIVEENLTNKETVLSKNSRFDVVNDESGVGAEPTVAIAQTDAVLVGHDKATAGTRWFQGWIGDLMVIKGTLSATNRLLLDEYVSEKWGTQ